jgi:hypothetical protein
VKRLLDAGRIIIVPVSNPDGYDASRTSGEVVDFREIDNGGTITIIGTPGNAYKRKNCRFVDGRDAARRARARPPLAGRLRAGRRPEPQLRRLWGRSRARATCPPTRPTTGPAPFSEPETQAIRSLISSRQVTTLISNHTFSNLILRPSASTRPPSSRTESRRLLPAECFTDGTGKDNGMQALGEKMAAQNGYTNQFGWELYDTTGTTEDYSYNATGGYGYTFEIGPNEFHPPFEQVVDEYTGENEAAEAVTPENAPELTTDTADDCAETPRPRVGRRRQPRGVPRGLRERHQHRDALADHRLGPGRHDHRGRAHRRLPALGRRHRRRHGPDRDDGRPGRPLHLPRQPLDAPFVQSRRANVLGEPREELSTSGTAAPFTSTDTAYVLEEPADVLKATVRAQQPAGADTLKAYDLVLLDTEENVLAEARGFASENTVTFTGADGKGVPAGEYVLRVEAGAPLLPAYELEAAAFDVVSDQTPGQVEKWNLTCTNGTTTQGKEVVVDRGQSVDVGDLCAGTNAPAPRNLNAACPPDRVPDNSHRDHDGNVHDRAIACVVWWEIAKGKTDTVYAPDVNVTASRWPPSSPV